MPVDEQDEQESQIPVVVKRQRNQFKPRREHLHGIVFAITYEFYVFLAPDDILIPAIEAVYKLTQKKPQMVQLLRSHYDTNKYQLGYVLNQFVLYT